LETIYGETIHSDSFSDFDLTYIFSFFINHWCRKSAPPGTGIRPYKAGITPKTPPFENNGLNDSIILLCFRFPALILQGYKLQS